MSQKQNGVLQRKTKDFQNILRGERAQRGWSQADVAEKIGSDPKTVGRWERGITFPGPYMCQKLTELYGKSLQDLGLVRTEETLPVNEAAEQNGNSGHKPGQHLAFLHIQGVSPGRYRGRRIFFSLGLLLVFLLGSILWWSFHKPASVSAPRHPSANPYARAGILVLNESLAAESAAGWKITPNDQGRCFFAANSYHILDVASGTMEVCLANQTFFTNFTYEVSMTILAGDCGGLAFRTTFPQLYYFLSCLDGRYRFVRYDRDNMANTLVIARGISPVIHQGLKATSMLAVVAINGTFKIYVNHTLLLNATDGAYLDGQVGVIAHTCRDPQSNLCDVPTEVSFTNARVWSM